MSDSNFTSKQITQFTEAGIESKTVEEQINNFKQGFPYAELVRSCTLNDGIIKLTDHEVDELNNKYDELSSSLKLIKFTPASGAASRMFKDLFEFLDTKADSHKSRATIKNLNQFAFSQSVNELRGTESISSIEDELDIADKILNKDGLNYGHLPKGLILFHKYTSGPRTAFEEHLIEGINYAKDSSGVVNLHFTVSPEHLDEIKKHIETVLPKYINDSNLTFNIDYSIQHKSTNTIAVNMDNTPFIDESGDILFRPGGHGALIQNLNSISADIVFIKNIDNVVPDRIKGTTYRYKKALSAHLIILKSKRDHLIQSRDSTDFLNRVQLFLRNDIGIKEVTLASDEEAYDYINRPIRACGMVKNEGEPGGGPFWVKSRNGKTSQQIVESSQVNLENQDQKSILESSSHFNPVDLICAITDHNGDKYDLNKFVDPSTGFISYKSKNGKELKAQELPGLWNGAMADWLTIFIEVPVITFNPVKTLSDLLRREHQPE